MKNSTKSTLSPLGVLDALDRAVLAGWRVFKSLKFGIFLLALIGAVAIWGTMGFASNAALGDNSIPMARTLVFEHPAFIGLLVLFSANLIVSTWHVTRMSVGIWWRREFRRDETYYRLGRTPRAAVAVPGGIAEAEATLRRRFTRVHRDGNAFFAHRGLASRIGPTIVHAGMLTVIGATVVRAVMLWNGLVVSEGRFVAAEGEEMAHILQPIALEQQIGPGNQQATPLDVWIKVLDFDEVKFPNSEVPAHFRSLVEVRDPDTQRVTVAQLDMNHSLSVRSARYGRLQFHQAGYQPIPDDGTPRSDFDVRDRATGERIAVADASPGDRVRVGETDLFLEVDDVAPGASWRLYNAADPMAVAASGLVTGGRALTFSVQPMDFLPDFQIDEQTGEPVNRSNDPRNPALRVGVFVDGRLTESMWLFHDPRLAEVVPQVHPRFHLALADIRVPQGTDLQTIDWKQAGAALFDVAVTDATTGERQVLALEAGQPSAPMTYQGGVDPGATTADPTAEGGFEVRVIGPTQRFLTVLSVVNEPTVLYVQLGVLIVLIGASMTFVVRYRAFHGLWDEQAGVLRMALVPRWGQSPVQEEFDALVNELSHGAGPVQSAAPQPEGPADEVAPEHETARPGLATT